MALVRHFRELRVYRQAFAAAGHIYRLSKDWPQEERYALTDQVRRSSRSVCANIAEAWRKRRYPAHFVSKRSDSDGEAAEPQGWLDLAIDCDYIEQDAHDELCAAYENVIGGLVKMMANPSPWCGPSQLRESSPDYDPHTPTRPNSHTRFLPHSAIEEPPCAS